MITVFCVLFDTEKVSLGTSHLSAKCKVLLTTNYYSYYNILLLIFIMNKLLTGIQHQGKCLLIESRENLFKSHI